MSDDVVLGIFNAEGVFHLCFAGMSLILPKTDRRGL